MSGAAGADAPQRERRISGAPERLLAAATALFARQGYERTSLRQIGALAEADPALVARYFGGKAELYLASVRQGEDAESPPLDLTRVADVQRLLDRVDGARSTPSLHAVVRPHEDPQLQASAMELLQGRLLAPLLAQLSASGTDGDGPARLRAQVAVAAAAGVALARGSGAFNELADAPAARVADLLADVVSRLVAQGVRQ